MVQGTDGSWYGYTANSATVTAGDAAHETSSNGLEFGTTCTGGSSGTAFNATGIDDTSIFDDVEAVWISADACNTPTAAETTVLGGAQALSLIGTTSAGQVGINASGSTEEMSWPFIQVYDFSAGPVEVCYLKSSGDECVLLDYDDTDSFNRF